MIKISLSDATELLMPYVKHFAQLFCSAFDLTPLALMCPAAVALGAASTFLVLCVHLFCCALFSTLVRVIQK